MRRYLGCRPDRTERCQPSALTSSCVNIRSYIMHLRRRFINSLLHGISFCGLPAIFRRFHQQDYCILMLHGVTDRRSHAGIGNTGGLNIHVDDFEAICRLLASRYNVISLEEALHQIEHREPGRKGTVILTFDDGYRSNYEYAYPVLQRFDLHATIFVATDFVESGTFQWWDRLEYALGHTSLAEIRLDIGNTTFEAVLDSREARTRAFLALLALIKAGRQENIHETIGRVEAALSSSLLDRSETPAIYLPCSWDQLREMHQSDNITVGAHTHTHPILGRCREDTIRQELAICRDLLEANLGIAHPQFAYPNGGKGDHDDLTRQIVQEHGFRCALTTEIGFNRSGDDLFTLRRFGTGNSSHETDLVASGTLNVLLAINDLLFRRQAS